MSRAIRHLVPAALVAGTLLLVACSDDSSTKSTTTAAPDTTGAPDTSESEVNSTAANTTQAAPTEGIAYQDPQELLNAIPGYTFLPLPDGAVEDLVQQVNSNPALSSQLTAVGAILLGDDATSDPVLVIFYGLTQPLTGADADAYFAAATAGGTDIIDVDVDGRPGKAFLSDGRSSFTTLTGTTAILAQAGTTDVLRAAVTALFTANPDL